MLTTDKFILQFTASSAVRMRRSHSSPWLFLIKGVSYGPPDPIQNVFALEPPIG
jgi:hypothetical protein